MQLRRFQVLPSPSAAATGTFLGKVLAPASCSARTEVHRHSAVAVTKPARQVAEWYDLLLALQAGSVVEGWAGLRASWRLQRRSSPVFQPRSASRVCVPPTL